MLKCVQSQLIKGDRIRKAETVQQFKFFLTLYQEIIPSPTAHNLFWASNTHFISEIFFFLFFNSNETATCRNCISMKRIFCLHYLIPTFCQSESQLQNLKMLQGGSKQYHFINLLEKFNPFHRFSEGRIKINCNLTN